MKSKLLQIVQYVFLLAIGIALCWLFFRGFDFVELKRVVSTGNFSWFYVVMFVSVLVYVFRVLRWQMLIKAIGYETKFSTIFSALSIGYFVNFALPRFGEVTRCLSVKKHHHIPFMELLGTVIIERVIDILSLIIVLLLTLILQGNQILSFFRKNIFEPIYNGIVLKLLQGNVFVFIVLFTSIVVIVFLFFYFRKYIHKKYPNFILQFIKGLKQGLTSIAKLQQKRMFLFYTFLIWLCYYLMTFFGFLFSTKLQFYPLVLV